MKYKNEHGDMAGSIVSALGAEGKVMLLRPLLKNASTPGGSIDNSKHTQVEIPASLFIGGPFVPSLDDVYRGTSLFMKNRKQQIVHGKFLLTNVSRVGVDRDLWWLPAACQITTIHWAAI